MVYFERVDDSNIATSKDSNTKSQRDTEVVRNSNTTFDANNLSFNRILVTYDGNSKSNKAINYSIYLSKITGADITILHVIGNIDKLENSFVSVSNANQNSKPRINSFCSTDNSVNGQKYSINVEGNIIESMEAKVKEIEEAGLKNKVSYKMRPGFVVDEITKETKESKYDLLVISSSHLDSWIKSLFSETRKIISNVDVPVLILH